MSEEASRRVQDEHDRMFPLRAGRSLYPKLSTVSSLSFRLTKGGNKDQQKKKKLYGGKWWCSSEKEALRWL